MNKQVTADQFKKLSCGSIIQHGPHNDRIYLMKMGNSVPESLPADLIEMAQQYDYSKIFVKVPSDCAERFAQEGYAEEASIPYFYNGCETGSFMEYFLDELRAFEPETETLDGILDVACRKCEASSVPLDSDEFVLRRCGEDDVEEMAAIYKAVFPTYPFPIHNPSYLRDSMQDDINYFGIERNGNLVALSSAEIDKNALNAEMTDFATLPQWRGKSFSKHLLVRMEKEMKKKGIMTAYTIARAISPGMNITFSKRGYAYAGRLKNNTNISGNLETMNVWYKKLS